MCKYVKTDVRSDLILVLKCLCAALIILAICSKSSFLYPLNNWGDANCYYTVAKGMLHGKVPYRDLVEQKGPIIFFLYALGELVSETSFIGIYFIEAVSAAIFLYFAVKTVMLYVDVKGYETGIVFAMAAIAYSSYANRHGGGPEELSLCIFGYLLYLGARYLEHDMFPNTIEAIVLGVCAGVLFWTKYNLCAIFVTVFAFVVIHAIKRQELVLVGKAMLQVLIGIIIVTIPVVGYFAANDATDVLFQTYFYDNIFLYRTELGLGGNLKKAVSHLFKKRNGLALGAMAVGMGWLVYSKRMMTFWCTVVSLAFSFFIFNAGYPQKYGCLPLFAFCVFGICPVIMLLRKLNIKSNAVLSVCSAIFFVVVAYVFCIHTYDILRPKSETPQYYFADEIAQSGIDNYSYLYYGRLDEGFYFGANYLPEWKAYITTNQIATGFIDIQNGYVNNREPDFIVSRMILCDSEQYEDVIKDLPENRIEDVVAFDDFGYEQIDEMTFYFEEKVKRARLYKRIS